MLARHAGAARFAFNQCLGMVKTALDQRKTDPDTVVPWTGFDLINTFNGWKKTEDAGRVFTVDTTGEARDHRDRPAVAAPGVPTGVRGGRGGLRSGVGGLVGLAVRCTQRQPSRLPPVQEEDRGGAVVSAAQQAPQGPPAGDPRRRQQPATCGHPARHRPDRCPRRHPPATAHARQQPGQDPVRHRHTPRRPLVAVAERAGRRPTPRPPALAPAVRATAAGGSVSIGVCRRFWSPRPPTARKSPASPMHPKRWPPA